MAAQQGGVYEFLGYPVKALPPGDPKEACVCTCIDCVEVHRHGNQFCECKFYRREAWRDFKCDVLEDLLSLFSLYSSALCVLAARRRPRFSFVELYRLRMASAVDEAVSSVSRSPKVVCDCANLCRVRDFYIPTPDYGYLAYFRSLSRSMVWRGGKWYSKLLKKLDPLHKAAVASVVAAIDEHNAAAELAALTIRSTKRAKREASAEASADEE